MLRDGLDVVIGMGIEMFAGLPLITAALNDVKKVRNHAGRAKCLTEIVEIDSPGIARAVGENFEDVPCADDSARRRR